MTNARPDKPDQHLPTPTPAVSVAVWRGDHVLLIRRGKEPNKGLWALPGGKIEAGETHTAAALRELLEETGVHAKIGAVFRVRSHLSIHHHYVLISMVAEFDHGAVRAGDDASDARFVLPHEIDQLDCVEDLQIAVETSRHFRK